MQQHSGTPCQRRRRRSCPGSGHPSRCSACVSTAEARSERVGQKVCATALQLQVRSLLKRAGHVATSHCIQSF